MSIPRKEAADTKVRVEEWALFTWKKSGGMGEQICILGNHVISEFNFFTCKMSNTYISNSLWWLNEITFKNAFHTEGAHINIIEISCKREEWKKEERKEGQQRPDQTYMAGT